MMDTPPSPNIQEPLVEDEWLDWMCISIHKEDEHLDHCIYRFTTTKYGPGSGKNRSEARGTVFGKLRISKSEGKLSLVEPMPGDDSQRVFVRAAARIQKHWAAGEYPDNTMYAAG